MIGTEDMKTFIESKLYELGEETSVMACLNTETDVVVMISAAFGGGGQEGDELLAELTKLGLVVKLAGLHGKQVTVLPQES